MKRNLSFTAVMLGALLLLSAFVPVDNGPVNKLIAALQQWTDTHPQEKVYLHMDKPYYAVGDTIWFKGYLTSGSRHKFSPISGALYVDLINERDSVIKDLKLPVTNGMVMGDLTLGDDLKQGNYRVRAYTQWMRNAGEDYYFDKTFTVGNPVSANVITRAVYNYKTVNTKPLLTATLTYANDSGAPLTGKNIEYEVVINKKIVWRGTERTDARGNIALKINNENGVDFSGAYIKTSLKNSAGETLKRDFPIKAQLTQSDVQFFPEGGNLVTNLTSVIGFKAIGVDGLGINIKGKVTDDQGKEVAMLQTLHAGMGSFSLKPEAGRTYTASVTFADGSTKNIALQKAQMEGYILNVAQTADSVEVRVKSSTIMSPVVNIIAQSGGEVIIARQLNLNNNAGGIRLAKKLFPTGIAQFSLFNAANEPLAERIAFVRTEDQLILDIKSSKNTYYSKETAALQLQSLDSKNQPTMGFFSISVTDETKVPFNEDNETNIFTDLLLTSDIKGHVERPNYYFKKPSTETEKALDNLMLTQGYRRFTWQGLKAGITQPVYAAEGLCSTISGRATTLGDKPAAGAAVMLLSVKARIHKLTTTNADGKFKFEGIFLTDSIKFAVQARTAKNSDKIKIVIDSIAKQGVTKNINLASVDMNIAATLKAYNDNLRKQDSLFEKLGMLDKVNRLRQININARKKQQSYSPQGFIQIPPGYADQTYYMKVTDRPTLGLCLHTELAGVIFREYVVENVMITHYPHCYYKGHLVPMAVILDGRKLAPFELVDVMDNNFIEPEGIDKIEVYRTLGGTATNIVGLAIMIYTKAGYVRKGYNPAITNLTPKGFNRAREFYNPRYEAAEAAKTLPDTRSTIYWDPRLQTGLDGQAVVNYFNADGPGKYRVVIEGMNAEGELGRQTYTYTVQ